LLLRGLSRSIIPLNLVHAKTTEHSKGSLVSLLSIKVSKLSLRDENKEREGWLSSETNKVTERVVVLS
jgi:hypothetical protein